MYWNIGIAIFGAIAAVVAIILPLILENNENGKKFKQICKLFAVVGAALCLFGLSFKIVPTGYTGVRTTFGQISDKTVRTGFNFKIPIAQQIQLVNNKQQDIKFADEDKIWGETSEKTPVYAQNIIITYQINPEKSAWIYRNVSEPDKLIEQSMVSSAIKSAMIELDIQTVTNRSVIEPLIKDKLEKSLAEKYGEDTVMVMKVVINGMDFEESYNNAIAEKSVAQQTYEKQVIDNKTALEKAEADKQVAIMNAEAQAEAKRIAAQAEADANEKISASLNDDVLQSKFYDKWNGELPQVMGENAVIADIGQGKPQQ